MQLRIYESEYHNHIFCDACVRKLNLSINDAVDIAFENDTCDLCGFNQKPTCNCGGPLETETVVLGECCYNCAYNKMYMPSKY